MGGTNRIVVMGTPHHRGVRAPLPVLESLPGEPAANETWWHKTEFDPALVIRVNRVAPGDKGVSFRPHNGSQSILLMKDFLSSYQKEAPQVPCKVGEEWCNPHGDSFHIVEITEGRMVHFRTINGVSAVPFKGFLLGRFTKVVRTSALDRLMGGDDF